MRVVAYIGILLFVSFELIAQTGVGVEVDEVVDNRVAAGEFTGQLQLRLKLKGTGLDKASAARVVVKDARDDKGTVLADGSSKDDFTPRDYNSGMLQVSVKQPARAASTVHLKGSVELFVPTRDPSSVVKVDRAFAKLDTPLASKALAAEKLVITPMSRAAYMTSLKSRKLDEKAIEEIRAEGKKRGVPEKEIEMAIGLAQAMEAMDTEPPEGAVLLSGRKSDFDRIFRIEVLGKDGKPIDTSGRSTSSRGEDSLMTIEPRSVPPADAALQIYVLTAKSRVSFPFEMDVKLP
jgi:hypothetical protein